MDIRAQKTDERISERGDLRKNLVTKLLAELDIVDLVNRDRGDSKANEKNSAKIQFNKQTVTKDNVRKSEKNTPLQDLPTLGMTELDVNVSKVKTNNITRNRDSIHNMKSDNKVPSKGKTNSTFGSKLKAPILAISRDTNFCQETKRIDENTVTMKSKINISDDKIRKMDVTKKHKENCDLTSEKDNKLKKDNELKAYNGYVLNSRNIADPAKYAKNNFDRNNIVKVLETRKLLRQKHTRTNNSKQIDNNESENNNISEDIREPSTNKKNTAIATQKRACVETVRPNHDNRVYKAITFTERKESTSLQIKMPKSSNTVETDTKKSVEVDHKSTRTEKVKMLRDRRVQRKSKMNARTPSPTLPVAETVSTEEASKAEVAKWAPCCINEATKPYYEAWVDTTLTAVTTFSGKEKELLNEEKIIRTFKRAFDMAARPGSPDLAYNGIHDEKIVGRITVRRNR